MNLEQPYQRKNRNTFCPAIPKPLDSRTNPALVHPAWWEYSDSLAASKRKREQALNDAYTRRISEAAYLRQYDAIWDIFDSEARAARMEYEAAIAEPPATSADA